MTVARIVPDTYDAPTRRSWIELMGPAVELAKAIATTDFVPRAMRNNPAAISAAILYGDEVGIGPMQSLAKIAVIEGRPFIAAEAQRALVFAAGHDLWIEEATNTRVTWCGRRAGSDEVTRITWTADDARRAHLDGKPSWRAYPRAMLSARASAELVRARFADVIGGLGAIEEADDVLEVPFGPDVSANTQSGPDGTKRRRRATGPRAPARVAASEQSATPDVPAIPARPPLPDELEPPPEPVHTARTLENPDTPDTPDPITSTQSRRMHALFRDRGITERAARLTLTREVIGRDDLGSAKDLTTAEADRLLDYLESMHVPAEQQDLDL